MKVFILLRICGGGGASVLSGHVHRQLFFYIFPKQQGAKGSDLKIKKKKKNIDNMYLCLPLLKIAKCHYLFSYVIIF